MVPRNIYSFKECFDRFNGLKSAENVKYFLLHTIINMIGMLCVYSFSLITPRMQLKLMKLDTL